MAEQCGMRTIDLFVIRCVYFMRPSLCRLAISQAVCCRDQAV